MNKKKAKVLEKLFEDKKKTRELIDYTRETGLLDISRKLELTEAKQEGAIHMMLYGHI